MRNYDQLDEFIAYTDRESWQTYIENTVVPLWESAWTLKEFHTQLQNELDGRQLDNLPANEQQLVLGGIDPRMDDVYRRNSLARFYRDMFAVQVADLQSWLLSEGNEVQTSVEITVDKPHLVELADTLHEQLTRGLSSQYLHQDYFEPDVAVQTLLDSPEAVRDIVQDFYQNVLAFAVNNSHHTFFIWSLNQVPRHFLEKAYPQFEEVQQLIRDEFGLRELEWEYPIKPDAKIYDDYHLLCFPEYNPNNVGQSFGGAVCKANETIWYYFDDYSTEDFRNALTTYFNQVPNLKEEYRDRVEPRVTSAPDNWLNGRFDIHYNGLSAGTSTSDIEENPQSIMDLLDQAAPLLFLGLTKIRDVYDGRLSFEEI